MGGVEDATNDTIGFFPQLAKLMKIKKAKLKSHYPSP